MAWTASTMLDVMLRPGPTFQRLSLRERADDATAWTAVRGPLATVALIGCIISLAVSGRFTARLILGGAISGAIIPLIEIASVLAVVRRKRATPSLGRAIDLFFVGQCPWALWLVAFGAIAAWGPPLAGSTWTMQPVLWYWIASLMPVLVWSAIIDFTFFRVVGGRDGAGAARALLAQRLISWLALTVWFLGLAVWPRVVAVFER